MQELKLKYGCNPNQKNARVFSEGEFPLKVLNGAPGYINLLDALNGWQLVRELKIACKIEAAASFKHVSPAGASLGLELSDVLKKIYFVSEEDAKNLSPIACAYARARGADRMSSFGDFIALSDVCDESCARLISKEVSDGIIAPGFDKNALEILKSKKKGAYCILQIDPDYEPPKIEKKQIFGITFEQNRNDQKISEELFQNIVTKNKNLSQEQKRDLLVSLIVLKYTQSNSVCYAKNGQAIGIGAGQQSRIHCTRLAGDKADKWHLRQTQKVLDLQFINGMKRAERDNAIDLYTSASEDILQDGIWQNIFKEKPEPFSQDEKKAELLKISDVALGSDAFFPFGDNIERAKKSGVTTVAQPGGSVRDDDVIATCDRYGIAMAFTGVRLFHH